MHPGSGVYACVHVCVVFFFFFCRRRLRDDSASPAITLESLKRGVRLEGAARPMGIITLEDIIEEIIQEVCVWTCTASSRIV